MIQHKADKVFFGEGRRESIFRDGRIVLQHLQHSGLHVRKGALHNAFGFAPFGAGDTDGMARQKAGIRLSALSDTRIQLRHITGKGSAQLPPSGRLCAP